MNSLRLGPKPTIASGSRRRKFLGEDLGEVFGASPGRGSRPPFQRACRRRIPLRWGGRLPLHDPPGRRRRANRLSSARADFRLFGGFRARFDPFDHEIQPVPDAAAVYHEELKKLLAHINRQKFSLAVFEGLILPHRLVDESGPVTQVAKTPKDMDPVRLNDTAHQTSSCFLLRAPARRNRGPSARGSRESRRPAFRRGPRQPQPFQPNAGPEGRYPVPPSKSIHPSPYFIVFLTTEETRE